MTSTRIERTNVLGLGGWAAYANGVVSAVGLVFLVAMYASFAVRATAGGLLLGWVNDVSGVVAALLMLQLVVAVHVLLRPHVPILLGCDDDRDRREAGDHRAAVDASRRSPDVLGRGRACPDRVPSFSSSGS